MISHIISPSGKKQQAKFLDDYGLKELGVRAVHFSVTEKMDLAVNRRMCRSMSALAAVKISLADKIVLQVSAVLAYSSYAASRERHAHQANDLSPFHVLCF